jgi:hypothetical protein
VVYLKCNVVEGENIYASLGIQGKLAFPLQNKEFLTTGADGDPVGAGRPCVGWDTGLLPRVEW